MPKREKNVTFVLFAAQYLMAQVQALQIHNYALAGTPKNITTEIR